MPIRRILLGVIFLLALTATSHADKIDKLTRALMQDPSYKVRVQAALVLGKLADRRAVPALIQALHDENESVRGVAATSLGRIGDKSAANALLAATNDSSEFVRLEAKKALAMVANAGGGGGSLALPGPRAGARFFLAIGFEGGRGGGDSVHMVRQTLARELAKLPEVTLQVAGAGGHPNAQALASRRLQGYIVDGTIQRLSVTYQGGQQQIDCDLRAFVATYPGRSIKMMTTEGASLQTGMGSSEAESGKHDCLEAAVGSVGDDVKKFLSTLQ